MFIIIFIIFFFNITNIYSQEFVDFNNKNIPLWYLIKDQNNKILLYGTGSDANIELAKKKAFANLIEIILFNVNKVSYDKSIIKYEKEFFQNLENELFNIWTENYTVEKKEFINDKYYVLISIKRKDLFDIYLNKFLSLDKEIEKKIEIFNNSNIFSQIYFYDILKILILYAEENLKVLTNLSDFKIHNYQDKYNYFLTTMEAIKNNIKISLVIENDNFNISKTLEYFIINITKLKNITIIPNQDNVLKITFDIKKQYIYNKFCVDLNINFIFKYKDTITNYKTINFFETSDTNFNDTFLKIKNKLLEKIGELEFIF